MKIGLVCPYNMFRGGGVQECVRALQAELNRRKHDVYIITPAPRSTPHTPPDKMIFLGGAKDVKSPFHTTAQISFNAYPDAIKTVIDQHDFDILHFHEPWVPIMSRQLLMKSRSKNIATFHAKLPDSMMSKTIERVITPYTRSVLKYLNAYTAVSEAAALYIKDLTEAPITLISNGIELEKFQAIATTRSNSHRSTILYIGRLEKRKGVRYLLQAFKLVKQHDPSAKLIIAGDGPDRKKLEQCARQLDLDDVFFLGFVDEKEKLRLLKTADLFCSPALYGESFGIVLLEAMAAGLPIVAGDNPGYTAVLKERGSLSLVNPKYTDELARRLILLLHDEAIRTVWVEWATTYVKQFNYVSVVDQYEELYEYLTQKS